MGAIGRPRQNARSTVVRRIPMIRSASPQDVAAARRGRAGGPTVRTFPPMALAAAALLAAFAFPSGSLQTAAASEAEYRLDVTPTRLPVGQEETLQVRLLEDASGKPVTDVVIFRTRLDMSTDAMADMVEPLKPLPSPEPGIWRFSTRLTMAGRWLLIVQAKVPGQAGTVREEIVLTGFDPAGGGTDGATGGGHGHGH
jgi:hypothetical protein